MGLGARLAGVEARGWAEGRGDRAPHSECWFPVSWLGSGLLFLFSFCPRRLASLCAACTRGHTHSPVVSWRQAAVAVDTPWAQGETCGQRGWALSSPFWKAVDTSCRLTAEGERQACSLPHTDSTWQCRSLQAALAEHTQSGAAPASSLDAQKPGRQ